jgi:hypothetical protein
MTSHPRPSAPIVPELRPRELEALILVGRGKTDAEIGQILGVSGFTAHKHVEGARRAFMIVRALFERQISFARTCCADRGFRQNSAGPTRYPFSSMLMKFLVPSLRMSISGNPKAKH